MLIQNPDAAAIIRRQAGLTLAEGFPQNLNTTVQPTMDMTPRFHRDVNIFGTATANGTMLAAQPNKDIFLTYLMISAQKDVADTGTVIQITATVNGVSKILATVQRITLTAGDADVVVPLNPPVKIDRNTAVTCAVSGTWTVLRAICAGYEVNPSLG